MEKQGSSHQLDTFAQLDGGAAPEEPMGGGGAGAEMVDYMLGQTTPLPPGGPHGQVSLDKLSFSDVLQFADFGPRLALNQPSADHDDARDDDEEDSYFFRFQSQLSGSDEPDPRGRAGIHHAAEQEGSKTPDGSGGPHDHGGGVSESTTLVQQSDGGGRVGQKAGGEQVKTGRRKRPRSTKTSEEVESQRMTHIAVERNRRRQMNDYLRVLRSLMPGSYVQRGDQASIIGGAIEFIRELEQLIQCLESQKRRRLYGDTPRPVADASAPVVPATSIHEPPPQGHEAPPFYVSPSLSFPGAANGDGAAAAKVMIDLDTCTGGGLREEVAENKSSLADIEVRVLGEDAVIKVLSRRRPEQLIKTIAVLEEMHMSILHTNITTIEQTVLYSFNVKITSEPRFTAEEIVGAVHQILSFIDVNYTL
ncbi:hypothetical protein ZWY2020_043973 [Hordeum vulgare]|nr:hypothetical protein ZWY2020_043973 [Hordeum vulgare]